MKIGVIPDGAMIVVPLIEKNGHEYISPTNFSKYNNMDVSGKCGDLLDNINPYFSNELPSGVKGRLTLFYPILKQADAFIILNKRPKTYKRMYNTLNELILFGGTGCINAYNLTIALVKDKKVPTLELAYPTTKEEIINLIKQTNEFLKDKKI